MSFPSTGDTRRRFPSTHWTLVCDAADGGSPTFRESLEKLAGTYWRPVYAYLRRKWNLSSDEAKDLTQDFFAALTEQEMLKRLSPDRGKFRSYVMGALDNFVRFHRRTESAKKRGGGLRKFSLEGVEGFDPPDSETPEQSFRREWAQAILGDALREMEREYAGLGWSVRYQIFLQHEVDPPAEGAPSYEELAKEQGLSATDVRNHLHQARKALRQIVLDRVANTVAGEKDLEEEMLDLFSAWSE